ncbi:O-GlcNAc transferase [Geomonas limicola]|uniref:O-GlcNAc transferase n=1 Tax=Geomonas limicola TaxID=2740186 RepID=A0A6V8NCR0_9BACT|nr:tetratricopeptide repeat protein [Geomonas limicola]GFO70418.1 O-GlcNAc transferase [Geomonas limicola]
MRNLKMLLCVVLTLVTMIVFLQTATHQFINFDDPGYVTSNTAVKGGLSAAGLAWAFTSTAMSNWHPLTWLSHMIDVQFFGLDPRWHHLTSVFLHAVTVVVLFMLLEGMTGALWQSFFVALLFAVHPLHVESVAWVAERKDVLSCLFGLISLSCYVRYVKTPGARWYLASLLLFVASLMSKPMLVTLPLVMLLLDYWPLDRYGCDPSTNATLPVLRLAREKIPFFVFSALSSAITVYSQHKGGAMATLDKVPVTARIENALIAWVKYIFLMVWPQDLAILYPFPKHLVLWQAAAAGIVLVIISTAVVRYRRRFPYLLTGWFWYFITLLPVIGLVTVGGQSMADRYTYFPLIGLFVACCWLIPDLMQGWQHRQVVLAVLAPLVFSLLTAVTWRQLGYWKDDFSLFRHTLEVTSDNYLILNNYGIALDAKGNHAEAFRYFNEAVQVNPRSAMAYSNLGSVSLGWGKLDDAVQNYTKALEINPNHLQARAGMGKTLAALGRFDEAVWQFQEALKIDPSLTAAHQNLALLLIKLGKNSEAQSHYEAALQLDPRSPKAALDMGIAMAQEGKMVEALGYFDDAQRIAPTSVEAHFNRGLAFVRLNRKEEAAGEFARVLELRPNSREARHWLDMLQKQN